MDRSYEALLLDFGGVCLLNPVELHRRAESLLGLPPQTFTWMGPIDPASDDLWQRMISGNGLSERDYWTQRASEVGAAAGRELTVRDYMRLLYEPPDDEIIRPEAMATVRATLEAGIGVSILTNDMRAFHGREWEQAIELVRAVDHVVDCSETRILKPDRRAYERAVSIVGAEPERILFVDDLPRNVEGASRVGLGTVWFDVANAASAWAGVRAKLGLTR